MSTTTTARGYENAPATRLVATHCAVCNRPLVDADSLKLGIGPTCAARHGFSKVVVFPDWARVAQALSVEEYATLQIDALRPIYRDSEVARHVANALMYAIAADTSSPRTAARVLALAGLGYSEVAERIAERLGAVKVKEEGGVLIVEAPLSSAFIREMRAVPGSRWVAARRVREVPVASKEKLWGAIRRAFPRTLVIGSRLAVA